MTQFVSRWFLVALVFCVSISVAQAHPTHVSIAEAEFNEKTGHLEVALRVHPIDLEHALRKRTKTRVDLDKTPDVDKLILDYLQSVFVVKNSPEEQPYKLKWVGKEVTVKSAWLFFEIPKLKHIEGRLFSNAIFFETLENQVNTINFRQGEQKATLHLTQDRPRRLATFRKADTKDLAKPEAANKAR